MDLQHLVKPKISEFCEFTEKKEIHRAEILEAKHPCPQFPHF